MPASSFVIMSVSMQVVKTHRLVYHSTVGLRVIKKKARPDDEMQELLIFLVFFVLRVERD